MTEDNNAPPPKDKGVSLAMRQRVACLVIGCLVLGAAGCATEQSVPPQARGLNPQPEPSVPAAAAPTEPPAGTAALADGLQTVAAFAPATEEPKTPAQSGEKDKGKKQDETAPEVRPDAPPGSVLTPVIPAPAQMVGIDLPGALTLAGAENPTIAIARAAVDVAVAERQAARALLLPDLNAGMNYNHHEGNLQTSSGVILNVDRSALYFGAGAGAVGAGTVVYPGVVLFSPLADAFFAPHFAQQIVINRRFQAFATNNNILLDVGVRYYALVGAEGRLAAIRQSELEFGEVARLTAEHARTQQGRPADADRARSEVLLVHQQEQAIEEDVAVASAQLAQLLNLDPSFRLQSKDGAAEVLVLADPHAPLEKLIQIALAIRPEMKADAAAIAAARVRYKQECYRPFLPTVLVGYSYGGFGGGGEPAGTSFGHFYERNDVDAYAVWTLDGLGFGNLALQKERRAEVNQAQADLVVMVNRIRDEVAEAAATAVARERDLDVARRQLVRAQDGMRRDLRRIRALEGLPIEVLNSARLLASARQEFVNALTVYNQAQLQLFVSLGQPPTLAPAPPPHPPAAEAGQQP
jgi:outer membrane protein TolC